MAKFKIIWSIRAKQLRRDNLEFYIFRNGNNIYSKQLNAIFNRYISKLSKYPFLGKISEYENIRCLVIEDYEIIYKIDN